VDANVEKKEGGSRTEGSCCGFACTIPPGGNIMGSYLFLFFFDIYIINRFVASFDNWLVG
jgi:hypothetical protein